MIYRILIYIFFSSLVLINVFFQSGITSITDEAEYLQLAKNLIVEGRHYAGDLTKTIDFRLYSKRPVGYPMFLILSQNVWIAKLVQSLLPFVVFIFGFEFLMSKTSKKRSLEIYAILFLLSLPLFASSSFLLSDGWLMVIVSLAFFTSAQKLLSINYQLLVYSISVCFGVLLKPVVLPITLLFSLSIFRKNFSKRLFGVLPLSIVLIYTAFQYKQTGVAEYSSITATNLGQYNARLLIASEYGQDSASKYLATETLGVPQNFESYKLYQQNLKRHAKETITGHSLGYIKLQTLGMIKFFLEPGRFEISNFIGTANNDISFTQAIYGGDYTLVKKLLTTNPLTSLVLLLLFIISLFKLLLFLVPLKNKDVRLGYLLVGYFAFVTGPLGAFRFTIPVYFLILIISVLGSETILDHFQKSSKT